ncbi:MAG TPA: LptF/LptG family permease [Longimicrobiales bacterium]|nr:LptF/LptG family permease [Longimicrobiales bacterium]
MSILTRYILKAHVAPFFFGLSVLTGVIFINAVSKRIENELAGKGLALDVIGEVLALSLPHVIALTLPMAVLVAVLHAFSSLAAENEIAALKASGVNLLRLLAPPLAAATLLCATMIVFNDTVLPDTNHRLAGLIQDINRKSPTLSLREQVLNEIKAGEFGASTYYLKAGRIEPGTNRLWDVVIYDLAEPNRRRTIYADSGKMAFNQQLTDLFLTLHDGVMLESDRMTPQRLQRADFDKQLVRIAGVGNQFERQEDRAFKSDREMDFGELAEVVATARVEREQTRDRVLSMAHAALDAALAGAASADLSGGPSESGAPARRTPPAAREAEPGVVGAADASALRDGGLPLRGDADVVPVGGVGGARDPAFASGPTGRLQGRARGRLDMARVGAAGEAVGARAAAAPDTAGRLAAAAERRAPATQRSRPRPTPEADQVTREANSRLMQWASVGETHEARIRQYEVEFWKKLAIPAACIVFVLIGAPIGIRFPRGGVGMVIMVSLAVFAVYYAGLIGGESLADEGILTPFWAMWSANLIFLIVGLWAVSRIGRESATSRGGGWDDLLNALRYALTWPLRALRLSRRNA